MATQVFGERRRLQKGLPLRVNVLADGRFRADAVAAVFFIPTTIKTIHEADGQNGVDLYGFGHTGLVFFTGNARNAHPMCARRDFFHAHHQVPVVLQCEGVAIPKSSDF